MEPIVLKNQSTDGANLEAVFHPEKGMSLLSYSKSSANGKVEVIEQSLPSTLICPRFGARRAELIPSIPDINRFSPANQSDPFFNGIARYAPWTITGTPTETQIKAVMTGKDQWQEVPLATFENDHQFKFTFEAELLPSGLQIALSTVSEVDSLVGLQCHYRLPEGKGKLTSKIQKKFMRDKKLDSLDDHELSLDLEKAQDFVFYPFPNPLEGNILLETANYKLLTVYQCNAQENAWIIQKVDNQSFVSVGPVSAQDPWHPNLTVSSLKIHLQIL